MLKRNDGAASCARSSGSRSCGGKKVLLIIWSLAWLACGCVSQAAAQVPPGFSEEIVFNGLTGNASQLIS